MIYTTGSTDTLNVEKHQASPIDASIIDQIMGLVTSQRLVVTSTSQPGQSGRVTSVIVVVDADGKEFLALQVEFLKE